MKIKLLLLISAVFIFSQMIFAQSVEKQIVAIRAEVAAINKNEKSYTKTTKDVEGVSLEGTEATYFSSAKGLKKIVSKSYGEMYNAETEIYYQDDKVIFIFQKFNQYNVPMYLENSKITKTTEKRFYFTDGKMIRFLNGKTNVKNTTKFWEESKMEVLHLEKKLKAEI